MPIEVHCPNPGCARVHLVKDRYAGYRGKCPACAHWMYVGRTIQPAAAPKPANPFGWAAVACLLLGMAGLAALAATPALPQSSVEASGDFAAMLSARQPEGINPEHAAYVTALPLLACLFPLGALLAGAIGRRPGFASLALTYLSVAVASAFAFMALWHFGKETADAARLERSIQAALESGKQGAAVVSHGLYLHVGMAGAVGAAVLFLAAAFALHRRWWTRILSSVALGFPLAVGALWVFKDSIGLGR